MVNRSALQINCDDVAGSSNSCRPEAFSKVSKTSVISKLYVKMLLFFNTEKYNGINKYGGHTATTLSQRLKCDLLVQIACWSNTENYPPLYVYMCVKVLVCVRVYVWVYVHVCVYLWVCACVCMYLWVQVYVCGCIYQPLFTRRMRLKVNC